LTSAGSGWDGALLADLTTAPAGSFHQDHELVVVQRWSTPLCVRTAATGWSWTTYPPAVSLRFPGDSQHGRWRGATDCQLLFVTPARVEAVLGMPWDRGGLPRWREPSVELPFAAEVLSALAHDVEDGYPAGPLTGDALVGALLAHLERRGAAAAPRGPRTLGRRLDQVVEYIEANLARPLRLSELAEVACVRVRRLSALFAAEAGCPPHRYVLLRRVERAKVLMGDPELSLAHIARAVGFSGPSQLSRVFRQLTGETPRAYRGR
jgi:AraC-like DNA-binding protein